MTFYSLPLCRCNYSSITYCFRVIWRSLEDRSHTSSCWSFTVTMAQSCIISEIKRNSKVAIFFIPHLYSASRSEGSRLNIAITFGSAKLEWWVMVYQTVKKFENMLVYSLRYNTQGLTRNSAVGESPRDASCHLSLNVSLSHSRSLKVIRNDTRE